MKKPTNNEALALWQKLARGERNEEVDAWIQVVASGIVKDVFLAKFDVPANRAGKALSAVGFKGKQDTFPELTRLAREETGMTDAALAKVADLIVEVPPDLKKTKNKINYARKTDPLK